LQPSLATVETGRDAGLPVYYTVIQDLANGTLSNLKMHHSRAIRQIGIQLPAMQAITEQWWGESVIERLYDRLIAFDTATSGAANLIQKAHLRTIKIDKLREVFAAGGKAEENLMTMFSYMGIMQNNEGITLLDSADEFQTTSYSFAGLSDMILQFGQQISGATGIPLVRLFGQSPAGLSATGEADMRMYYDNINAQQETDLREGMLKLLRILHKSVLNTTAADTFDFDFSSLWQASTKEKAEIANATVTAIKGAIEAGVIDNVTALQELKQSSEHTGIFTNITEEQIAEAKSLPPPVPIESAPVTADRQSVTDRIKTWLSNA
jgi:phage-related protein (TIGR01555 family)